MHDFACKVCLSFLDGYREYLLFYLFFPAMVTEPSPDRRASADSLVPKVWLVLELSALSFFSSCTRGSTQPAPAIEPVVLKSPGKELHGGAKKQKKKHLWDKSWGNNGKWPYFFTLLFYLSTTLSREEYQDTRIIPRKLNCPALYGTLPYQFLLVGGEIGISEPYFSKIFFCSSWPVSFFIY